MANLSYDVLINKENKLESDYVPDDLYVLDENEDNFHKYNDPTMKPMLSSSIKPYVDKMMYAAKQAGFPFIVDSGYRSFAYQEIVLNNLFKEKGMDAYNLAAQPGSSEHQTGFAFDIAYLIDGIYSDDVKDGDLTVVWLINNSYKYGFILRYPKGKEKITGYDYEPWHFRFVGLDVAKIIHDEDLTLEEYYTLYKNEQKR